MLAKYRGLPRPLPSTSAPPLCAAVAAATPCCPKPPPPAPRAPHATPPPSSVIRSRSSPPSPPAWNSSSLKRQRRWAQLRAAGRGGGGGDHIRVRPRTRTRTGNDASTEAGQRHKQRAGLGSSPPPPLGIANQRRYHRTADGCTGRGDTQAQHSPLPVELAQLLCGRPSVPVLAFRTCHVCHVYQLLPQRCTYTRNSGARSAPRKKMLSLKVDTPK